MGAKTTEQKPVVIGGNTYHQRRHYSHGKKDDTNAWTTSTHKLSVPSC